MVAGDVDMHSPLMIAKSKGGLHLDHGRNHTIIDHCIRGELTSMMVDASLSPLEENIKKTRRVVEMVHVEGVAVEAKLGLARDLITPIVREKTQRFGSAGKAQEVRS